MGKKILIVIDSLVLGGGEKLSFEICKFAQKHSITPVVLIPNNLKKEYYDDIFAENEIKVVRIHLAGIKKSLKRTIQRPSYFRHLYWNIILRFFLKLKFSSVHIIKLPFIAAWGRYINHNKRYLWHVANNCQYPDNKYDYDEKIFLNENDTIVYISQYQVEEIHNQYDDVRCKEVDFKLFINKL